MKRFDTWWMAGASVCAWLCVAITAQARPNVLFIVCDDLNTHVGPSGYESIMTPALDGLAADAMTFRRAYCQYPVCGPSRASFLSGLYPESSGVLDNKVDIRDTRPGTVSMPQAFKESGYWTAATGKVFHNEKADHGDLAWDEVVRFQNDELPVLTAAREAFESEHGSVDDRKNRKVWKELAKEVIAPLNAQTPPGKGRSGLEDAAHKDGKNARQIQEWLEGQAFGDKPFFIACGIHKPHVPFLAPDKYFDMYPPDSLQYTLDPSDLWEQIPAKAVSARYGAFGFELGEENEALRREYMQAYHACITFIDAQIGLILDAVKEAGLWEDTIIVFTSDHGYHLGEHFMWGKVTLFEVCDRVPLIMRVPGMTKAGSVSEALVELVDLYPTLAELGDVEVPDDLQGVSMVPLLEDAKAPGRKVAYTVVGRGADLGRAIRTEEWRYAAWPDGEELYFLPEDAEERVNLAGNPEYRPRLREMRKLLEAKVEEALSARERQGE